MASDEFSRALGARLRAERMARKLTLQEVTEKLPGNLMRPTTLRTYEVGSRPIPAEKFAQLAAFYGVPAADLIP